MAKKSKFKKIEYKSYDALSEHPFTASALHYGVRILGVIEEPLSVLKTEGEFKREPTKAEYYCISVAKTLAHLLGICQQLEHSVLYFSSFSPSVKMKKAGISKQSHLLYCIENYIVRTHSMYDRLLRHIDSVFEIYNPSHLISHEFIISNLHVKHSPVPPLLKSLRKVIKDYYRDRNMIIHEQQYIEDDLRMLEAITCISSSDDPFTENLDLDNWARNLAKKIVLHKTKEFSNVNQEAFKIIGSIFDHLQTEYDSKRSLLETVHGKSELIEIPTVVRKTVTLTNRSTRTEKS